jgi:putative ABC transport system ATP-binding protein
MGLLEVIHKAGNTIIVVTHEEDIAQHAHRIIRLIDGNISSDEKNKNIRTMEYYKNMPVSE